MTTPEAPVGEAKAAPKAIVLAAVDTSVGAGGVVQQAAMEAMARGAALHVVQVIEVTPTIVLGSSPVLVPSSARLIQQSWQELERLLSEFRPLFSDTSNCAVLLSCTGTSAAVPESRTNAPASVFEERAAHASLPQATA